MTSTALGIDIMELLTASNFPLLTCRIFMVKNKMDPSVLLYLSPSYLNSSRIWGSYQKFKEGPLHFKKYFSI